MPFVDANDRNAATNAGLQINVIFTKFPGLEHKGDDGANRQTLNQSRVQWAKVTTVCHDVDLY